MFQYIWIEIKIDSYFNIINRDEEYDDKKSKDINKDLKNSVYNHGMEMKLQRNVLDQYVIEETRLRNELFKKRMEFEKRINVCQDKQTQLAIRQEKVIWMFNKRNYLFDL